ncbi:MAG: restriction endonuclease subunit S [Methylicorpusculum sp.]|uniref:restriction endonuclease subunit S n=1 Tax=Methylicorpusculum sp. TaxID=2713644 RepID=UPI002728C252|nr:restriction endonuclease subunit S [Methylicorpusculum sp.]MDO8937561.1 restriction endonuclease subunit S [Methylicorpusculum sp.]MDP2204630.1 restriction endonuclease subunit S [Methylicorpusculum sp.]
MNNIEGRVSDSVTRQEAGGITSVLWQPCLLSEWPATQAKHVFDISLGKMLQPSPNNPDDVETPYIKAINVQWSGINTEDLPTMWASSSEIKALNLKIDDLLVCEGGEVGRASILSNTTPDNCIYQNALHRVRSETNNVRYLKYCLKQASESGWFDVLCNRATIAHFTVEKFRELRIHIPPPKTQHLIADYLDRETAHIDALVAEKEKMLALLEEKRAALISRAVSRGLNPDAPLKPSGLDWLGDIPTHWELQRLKHLAEVRGGLTLGKQYSSEHLHTYPYLRVANVQDGHLLLQDVLTVDVPISETNSNLLAYGDVLMNEGGDIDKLGRCCVWRDEIKPCLHQNHVFAVRPRSVDSEWLALWTSTFEAKRYFESRAKRSTNLASISSSNVKEL